MANKIEFTTKDEDGKEIKLVVKRPGIHEETQARFIANDTFTKALKSGALFKDQLDTMLRERGLWDDAKQKKLEELNNEMKSLLLRLKKGGIKKSEGRKIAIDIRVCRGQMVLLLADRNKFDDFTVESQIENEKFNYYVSACTYNESGEKVFKSVEDYQERANTQLAVDAALNLSRLTNGLDPDWQKKLPENKFLLDNGFANNNLDLVDKEGHRVTIDNKRIDDNYNYVAEVDGKEVVVDESGNRLDEDGLPIVESAPFLDD